MMLSGVGVLSAAKNPTNAEKFVTFLLEKEQQAYFTNEVYEYRFEPMSLNKSLPDIRQKLVTIDQNIWRIWGPRYSFCGI